MNLSLFDFQSKQVRTTEKDGEVWFVAADVCAVLDITNVGQALSRLDTDEAAVYSTDSRSENGVTQSRDILHVTESGLYALVFSSRKAEAKVFRKWVTSVVLPKIRKDALAAMQKALDAKTAEVTMVTHQKDELDAICASAKMSPKTALVRTAKSLEKVSGATATRNHTLEVVNEALGKELAEWKHRALTAEKQLTLITKGYKQ